MTDWSSDMSRVTRSKAEAEANYDRLSRWYDWLVGPSEKRYREAGLAMLAPQSGETIAEIGFGTGHCLCSLAEAVGSEGAVIGVDLSEGMRRISERRLARAGLQGRVTLLTGDAVSLLGAGAPLTSLDAIFSSFAFELFDTPELPILAEGCLGALRSGGRLCTVSLYKPEQDTWPVRLYEWAHRVMPRFVDCRPIRTAPLLRDAGFVLERVEMMVMWGLPVELLVARKP